MASLASATADPGPIYIDGDSLKFYVDGTEFFIKGMCYHPTPLGYQDMYSNQTGGTGFCSPKRTVYGEWKSACFDSDFFDGSSDNGPSFQPIWDRDLPHFKKLGVNTLRLYNINPMNRQASIRLNKEDPSILAVGKDHVKFMDWAHANGLKVIYPIFMDATAVSKTFPDVDPTGVEWEKYKELIRQQIDEVGNHPALLMWNVGNEILAPNDVPVYSKMLARLQDVLALVKDYQSKTNGDRKTWTRWVPTTHAVVDLPFQYDQWLEDIDVEVFSTNAGYRGNDFSNLWTGDASQKFSGFNVLCKKYKKPVFIAEFGTQPQAGTTQAEYLAANPQWYNRQVKDMLANQANGCIGGAFFEFSDELSKADPQQRDMGMVMPVNTPAARVMGAWVVDPVVENPIYKLAANGTVDGIPYRFNVDVFNTLLGRAPATSTVVPTTAPTTAGPTTTGPTTVGPTTAAPTVVNPDGTTAPARGSDSAAPGGSRPSYLLAAVLALCSLSVFARQW